MTQVSINCPVVVQPMSVVSAIGIRRRFASGLLRHMPSRARPPSP